jgi:ATP-dependent Clp protease adaptor protein ClpS
MTITTALPQRTHPKRERTPTWMPEEEQKIELAPLFNLVLWNDDFHSFVYVIKTLVEVLHISEQDALEFALKAHTEGKTIILTTQFEEAEFKKEQIESRPNDPYTKIDSPLTLTLLKE